MKSALAGAFVPATFWKVAIYMRLSKEDYTNAVGQDSGSIKNQRIILRKHAQENGLVIINEFVDDGYSGTNFNRPGFQELLNAIRRKEINCVITKDLSRLGRNHLEVGYYIENFFPENRVRYIAVNEQYDSLNGDSDIVPFMNIINEMAAKQASKKNRQVFESKFNNGGMHSRHVTYGYIKDPDNINHRLIDEEVVDNVRRIFDLAEAGASSYMLQKWLFENKIECPSYRIYKKTGMYSNMFENCPEERKYKWNTAMLRKMLCDMTYLGHSVHYKNRTISYKNKKKVSYPKDQWMIVENTHEPIITQEQFDHVQENIGKRFRAKKDGGVALFSGMLQCSCCGGSLARYGRKGKSGDRSYYVCIKHALRDVFEKCSPHYTSEKDLSEMILKKIQTLFMEAKVDKRALAEKLSKSRNTDKESAEKKAAEELETLQKRARVLVKLISKVYEDWAEERITEENFRMLFDNYQKEQTACAERISELSKLVTKENDKENSIRQFVDIVDQISYPAELTRELLFSLISKIVIYEPVKNEKGTRNVSQQVDIHWRHIGVR